MSTDYIVASLPTLRFDEPAPISWEKFLSVCGDSARKAEPSPKWRDIEIQLRNASAIARGASGSVRAAEGCSLYWKKRILDCFAEKDVMKRDTMIDRVWWDAAGELTPPHDQLGKGALETYAIRLKISLRRAKMSKTLGNATFDRLTAASKITF